MCLYPRIIKNRKYTVTKKNGGQVPPIFDERVLAVPVGCGECMECRKQKAREWQARLLEDVRHNKNGIFITLTFSNESIAELTRDINKRKEKLEGYNLDNEIATLATRRFLERWRKEYKKSLRHWLVTELGHNGTENIHMHGIVWTDEKSDKIEKHWKYGYIWAGNKKNGKTENYVSERTVNYIVKYINKRDDKHKYYKSKILTSAGIGKNYLERGDWKKNIYQGEETREDYRTRTGHSISMPIYWRNKIYTEEEREKLWIIKLDKNERWVGGEKTNLNNGDKEYYQLLEYYREKNKRLGYGTGEINWNRKNYENQRRILKQKERIEKGGGLGKADTRTQASGAGRVHPTGVERAGAMKPNDEFNGE